MKKTVIDDSSGKRGRLRFIFLTMKLFAIFVFVGSISVSANDYPLKTKSDLQLVNSTLKQEKVVSGSVKDLNGEPIPGVSVIVKGTHSGTITDVKGLFKLTVPEDATTLVFSFLGMKTQEVSVAGKTTLNVVMVDEAVGVEEVVIVGYGQQKKESIVGSIVHATGEQLAKTGATTNLSRALQGQLPGVTTIQISGEPGREDPRILIRSQGTWNNSSPLILVDGVERSMSDINVSEVASISVLKDASATAVFGVKGAEGVILITTNRGVIGKPKLTLNANTSAKFLSRTPDKLDSYEGYRFRNEAIEYELSVNENAWGYYVPKAIVNRYKLPQAEGDQYIFPNVDWPSEQLNDHASSSQIDLTVSGGTEFTKYFGAISYTHEGDLLNSGLENGKGYRTKLDYNRFNFRTNLDFNLTKSTVFTVNLSGYVGTKWGGSNVAHYVYDAFYQSSPALFPVRFPDGSWGYNPNYPNSVNPLANLNNLGTPKHVRTQVTTDFALKQNLDFLIKGLNAQGSLSYDNRFYTSGGMTEPSNNTMVKYIDPGIIDKLPNETDMDYTYGSIKTPGINDYDWVMQPVDYLSENSADLGSAYRRLFYQVQLNYARKFNKHDVSATFLMNREKYASGSEFPRYREDWVGRITYNYEGKYLFEANGAYNGSEKFSPEYRFGFFPSVAVGWMASNETLLKKEWLDKLKIRYSIGKVGNDNFNAPRWSYMDTWAIDPEKTGSTSSWTNFGSTFTPSPYAQYLQSSIANPNLQWEVSLKQNLGFELAVLNNMFNLNVDLYRDDRDKIFMSNTQRKIPNYFGAAAVAANLGQTESKGYEIEFKYQNRTSNQLSYWLSWTYTHAMDKVVYFEDPILLSDYQKSSGFQIDQTRSQLGQGFLNNWDEVYSSLGKTGNGQKLPGDFNMVDFNGDGKLDTYDVAPYSYPERPQNTYTFALGGEYKGFSLMLQFYGVYNVSRTYGWYMYGLSDDTKTVVFENQLDTWRPWNTDASWNGQRLLSSGDNATRLTVDGSFLRLKNAEIAYTFSGQFIKNIGVSSTKVYLNGNNLLYFSKMMDDRETNNVTNGAAYPMFRTVTFGLNVNF